MNLKYSMPSEEVAETLILALNTNEEIIGFGNVKGTETTHAIVCLGFQDEYGIDENGDSVLLYEGTTYDVDVAWIETTNEDGDVIINDADWSQYEVIPVTSNHNFA